MKLKRQISLFAAALIISVLFASASFAWDSREDIRRLYKEAPALDVYKGAQALVWLDQKYFRMLADGSMEKTHDMIVMMGETIPSSWRELRIPIPSEGSVELLEASWYDPMTAMREGDLEVVQGTLKSGGALTLIRTPAEAVGRAVVISYRTKYPRRYGADGMIPFAGELPRWEQYVAVEVPAGLHLYSMNYGIKDAYVTKMATTDVYTWHLMNQEAWSGEGFVEDDRPMLYFGFQRGILNSLKSVNEYARVPNVPLPSHITSMSMEEAGHALMSWMSDTIKTLSGCPYDWVRPPEDVSLKGPWTPWEKTLILQQWLNKVGWETELWWGTETELDDKAPATMDVWETPVIVTEHKDKKVYYKAGQKSAFGILTPELLGLYLYREQDGSVLKDKIGAGSPSDNKFKLEWDLRLFEEGKAVGDLTVTATGGWTEIISKGYVPEVGDLAEILNRKINFALPAMALVPKEISKLRNGYKMDFKVRCTPGISHGGQMLLRLPGGIPPAVADIMQKSVSYTLRFPFTIEQKVRMDMPIGYKLMQTPPLANMGERTKCVLKESIVHWPKKSELVADSIWVVKTREIDESLAKLLRDELSVTMRWPVLDLPFKK